MTGAISGRIFDIQRFSIHDGPGIRTTVFFQGCPLRCLWCHNPEAMHSRPSLFYTERLCIFCRACEAACPEGVHRFEESAVHSPQSTVHGPQSAVHSPRSAVHSPQSTVHSQQSAVSSHGSAATGPAVAAEPPTVPPSPVHSLLRDTCRLCGACAEACVAGALEMAGREATVKEVVDVVLRDRVFYETSNGGVTLSGGEPLAQPAFAAAILAACRAEGLHTAVDTCGLASTDALEQLLPLTDLWLYDLKHLDPQAHREATGHSNERVLQNLCRLSAAGADVMLRMPLIPGFNDTEANLSALEALSPTLSCVRELRLLPYHRFQEDKYRRLGLAYPGAGIAAPDDAQVEAIRARLAASTGWVVGVGG